MKIRVDGTCACPLGQSSEESLGTDGDLVAGVTARFEGPLSGSSLLAMDPARALGWARDVAPDADPLAAYVEHGRAVLAEVLASLATSLGTESALGPAALAEAPVLSILLGTHAPSDTVVLSLRLTLFVEDREAEARAHLLIEPKLLASLEPGGAERGV